MHDLENTTHIFQTQRRHWLLIVFFTVFTFALFVPSCHYLFPSVGRYIGLAIWLIFVGIVLRVEVLPMWRTYILVEKKGVGGRTDQGFYEIYWIEIAAADFFRDPVRQPYLWIATRKYALSIPLKYLDAEQIWHQIQEYLSPEKLGDAACEKWLKDQRARQGIPEDSLDSIQNLDFPLCVRQAWWVMAFGWFGLAFFGGGAVISLLFIEQGFFYFLFFGVFTVMNCLVAFPDTIEMDAEKITRIFPPFGRYQMRWDEIERIEYPSDFSCLVLYGKDKRLPLVGPIWWAKQDSQGIHALLQAQIQQHNIETKTSFKSVFVLLPKNTRIK